MNPKRWTLVVVCAATAMLMLDIAVVNTALSRIAEDLDTGPRAACSGSSTRTRSRSPRRCSPPGRSPTASAAGASSSAGLVVFTLASAACAAATDIVFLDAARAVQGIGAAVMFAVVARDPRQRVPGREGARRRPRRLRRDDRRHVRPRPARRRRADQRPRLAVDLPHQPAARRVCLWVTRTYVTESRDPRAPRVDWLGQATLAGRAVPARVRLPARQRGRLGQHDHRRLAGRRGRAPRRLRRRSRAASRSRCSRSKLFRNPSFTGAQIAGGGDLGDVLRGLPLHTLYLQQVLGMSPIEAGLAYLPATVVDLLRLRRDEHARREDRAARDDRRRPRPRGRRHGADARWPARSRRGPRRCPACSSPASAPACSTRR